MTAETLPARDSSAPAAPRRRLGDVLVDRGALTEEALGWALDAQSADPPRKRRRLGRVLVDLGLIDDLALALALGELHNSPVVDLDTIPPDRAAGQLIPRAVAERHKIVAIGWRGRSLQVAVADPIDVVALDDVRMLAGAAGLAVSVAPERQIALRLEQIWNDAADRAVVDQFMQEALPQSTVAEDMASDSDAAAVKMVERMLTHAARLGASDVHVEPQRDGVHVRMRVDGLMRDVLHLPIAMHGSMVARLKIISGLDMIERRIPQDGRTRLQVEGRGYDVRVSTLPSLRGETVVLRLLPNSTSLPALSELGMDIDQAEDLRRILRSSQGLVLITGPTGSGKTNTLYAGINEVVGGERNVIALEDPVEVELPGTTQVQIDEKVGMTFARGLRAVLRQDPDVVLVGEMRDTETAELAVRAALTGHLVLSTLHTLDAPAALTRLTDMGITPYLVATSLSMVVAQRLVRRPCTHCAGEEHITPALATRLGLGGDWSQVPFRRAEGCPKCDFSGYRGRVGVFETLVVSPAVREALLDGGGETQVRSAALASGWRPLLQRAVSAAVDGRTTLAEVIRTVSSGIEEE